MKCVFECSVFYSITGSTGAQATATQQPIMTPYAQLLLYCGVLDIIPRHLRCFLFFLEILFLFRLFSFLRFAKEIANLTSALSALWEAILFEFWWWFWFLVRFNSFLIGQISWGSEVGRHCCVLWSFKAMKIKYQLLEEVAPAYTEPMSPYHVGKYHLGKWLFSTW